MNGRHANDDENRGAYGTDDDCTWHERANDATSELAVEAMHLAEVQTATCCQVLHEGRLVQRICIQELDMQVDCAKDYQ